MWLLLGQYHLVLLLVPGFSCPQLTLPKIGQIVWEWVGKFWSILLPFCGLYVSCFNWNYDCSFCVTCLTTAHSRVVIGWWKEEAVTQHVTQHTRYVTLSRHQSLFFHQETMQLWLIMKMALIPILWLFWSNLFGDEIYDPEDPVFCFWGNCFLVAYMSDFLVIPSVMCSMLTHLPIVPHICICESGQHWFR